MSDISEYAGLRSVEKSNTKRQKLDDSAKKYIKQVEKEEDPEFFEQLGIGMLESDESSSASANMLKSHPSQLESQESSDNEEDYNNHTISEDILETTEDDECETTLKPESSNIEIYSDPGDPLKAPIRQNPSISQVLSNHKGRSPLAIVSNNIIGQSNSVSGLKKVNLIYEDNFFLYRKRMILNTGEDHFAKLSDEITLQIFRWLPKKALLRCSLVSKQFNRVAQDESLWTRMDLSGKMLREDALCSILSRRILILRLAQAKIVDSKLLPTDEYDSKIQYLDLSMAVISKPSLKLFLSKCRRLKKLSLEHIPLDAGILKEISENKDLESLNMTMCEGIETNSLKTVLINLKNLRSLNISWTSLSIDCVKTFVENLTPNINQLNIAGCRKSMTDSLLNTLVTRCPSLLELDLSDCTLLSSDAVKIVCKLDKLEYLSLSRCYTINVSSYLAFSELKSLAFLDVFGLVSDHAITVLKTSFPTVGINKFIHSSVARPTVGTRRTSIWGMRTRD